MKKILLIYILITLTIFFVSCKKTFNTEPKAKIYIKTFLQTNYSEWGYYSNDKFHHVLSAFVIDSIQLPDTSFTSMTGVSILVVDGITYVDINGELLPIVHRTTFGPVEIHYVVENCGTNMEAYEILAEIRCEDNSIYDLVINGGGVQRRATVEDIAYFEVEQKRVININIKDYELYKNY